MKTILTRLKIFGLAFTIASSNAILLSGCSVRNGYYENYNESDESLNLTKEDENTITIDECANNNFEENETIEETNNDNIYFEKYTDKDKNQNETMDEIILTLEEKGISVDSNHKSLFSDLNSNLETSNKTNDEFEKLIISSLNIDKYFEEAFTSDVATVDVENHLDSNLYDSLNDDVYWDKLFDIVKTNNEKFLSEEENNWLVELYDYEVLSDEEINIVINYFHDFINQIKIDYPEFDMRGFTCHLSELKLFHYNGINGNLLETWSNGLISVCKYDENYMDFSKMKDLFNHEFKHFISTGCIDKRESTTTILRTGININSEDYDYSSVFSWRFLEEATAHQIATNISGNELLFYEDGCYLLDTIEMVNNFSGIKEGSILEQSIYHNPISLLQQFMILGNNQEELQNWLMENLEMLGCYNLLHSSDLYLYEGAFEDINGIAFNEDFKFKDDSTVLDKESYQKFIYTLEENANLHLLRLGIANISLMKQGRDEKLSLEDLIYLLKLLEYRINEQDSYSKRYYKLTIDHNQQYNNNYESLITSYFKYLENEYGVENVSEKYKEISLDSYSLSDAFSDLEREKYSSLYNKVSYIEYTDEVLSEIKEEYCKKISVYCFNSQNPF